MPKKVIVIGSGFAGLSSACYLAKQGFDVTILEKNTVAGGRARKFETDGFMFDMGPSWYWMPDVFEKFFADFGKKPSDYYDLKRLSPSYRVFYSKEDVWDIPSSMDELYALFESIEKGSAAQLKQFLKEAEYKYEVGVGRMVYKPGKSIFEYVDREVMGALFRLHLFKSMHSYLRKYFKDPRLLSLLEFPGLFLGERPQKTPALYSMMNYADMCLGTWYPYGGMYKIIEGMIALAKSLGVKLEVDAEVKSINIQNGEVKSVTANGNEIACDAVVAGADYHHVDTKLVDAEYRMYSDDYWNSRKMAPSCLLYYIGVNKRVENLQHHNLFFDEDFGRHATEIYEHPAWPEKPLFYLSAPSKTDHTIAPEGYENLFMLIPIAPGLEDTDEIREKYFNLLLERLKKIAGIDFKDNIVYKRSFAMRDFVSDYHALKGNAYGLANTLLQTGPLKPGIVNKKVKNLIYTGQLTVPGPGVPPALISGQLASNEVAQLFRQ